MTLGGDADQEATVLRGADEQLLVDHQAPAAEHRHLPEHRLVGEQVLEAGEERSLCGGHSRSLPVSGSGLKRFVRPTGTDLRGVVDMTAQPVELDYPFTGRWRVRNSPADRVPSHGATLFGLSYAIDFVPVDADGRSAPVTPWSILGREPPSPLP